MTAPSTEPVPAAAADLVYLVGCALHGLPAEEARVEAMDLDEVFFLSISLSLNALAAHALEEMSDAAPRTDPSWPKWEDGNVHALRRYLLFDADYVRLSEFLEDSGCWYAPLKGTVVANLYPEPWMRQACDRDVLFDAAYRAQVKQWFIGQGYTVEKYEKGVIDQYFKDPLYNFEMHTALIDLLLNDRWRAYYADPDIFLVPDEAGSCARHFSTEDFYIYMTLHAHKHHDWSGGTGLRSLTDTYVYLKAYGQDMDWAYIRQELAKLDIVEYERRCRELANKLFDDPLHVVFDALSSDEQTFLLSFVSFGSYGTVENRVQNQLQILDPDHSSPSGRTKFAYVWHRIFPDTTVIEHSYPFFWRHRWLLPVGYIYRLIYKGVTNHGKATKELRAVRKQ